MQLTKKRLLCITLPLALLTACSREPSEDALKQAYEQSLEQTNAFSRQMGGQHMQIKLDSFEKIDCQSATQGYVCQISVSLDAPIVGKHTQQGKVTVQKQQKNWVIIPD